MDTSGGIVLEDRSAWVRTWQNRVDNGGGDLLRNTPDGWVSGTDEGGLWWRGSDNLNALLASGASGYRTIVRDGIVYTVPNNGGRPEGLAPVGRATSLIADTLSGLPWRKVRGAEMFEAPAWITDPQLARPDARITRYASVNPMTNVSFWSQVIISQLWAGMAYVWVPSRDVEGAPKPPLFILNPLDVTVRKSWDGNKEPGIWLDDADGGPLRIPDDQVIVLPGQGPYSAHGVAEGLITRYARLLGQASVINAYTASTFTAGVPAGYLKSTNPNLNEEQANELRGKWEAAHGDGQRGIAVLNSAVEFHPIAFSPVDAALIESGSFTISQIALAFGLEPYMLGVDTASNTYANIESRQQHFATFSLLPWARRIEAALSAEFPRGTDLRIDMRGLLRADTATRYASYQIALAGGWLTVDEVRALEDLGPLPVDAPPPTLAITGPTNTNENEAAA
jgi:HK97 family phage portal protein